MFRIIYKFEGRLTVITGFSSVFDCLMYLEDEGFDIANPVDENTVTDGKGAFATIALKVFRVKHEAR